MGKITITDSHKEFFDEYGYLIIKGVFPKREIEYLKQHFMEIHKRGPIDGHFSPISEKEAKGDILKKYPRIMHPHKIDNVSMNYMLDSRIYDVLYKLLGEEPLAAQSMFYYKPPGAKGQALHQDNFYLKVEPGTCIAAWTAIDPSDKENGGLHVVPNTQNSEIQCPHAADPELSFTYEEVDVPDGLEPIPAILDAGDVLFFNGNVIHGSYPNKSKNRFRRSFICHYAGISTTKAGSYYKPLYRQDGSEYDEIRNNTDAGPCGTEYSLMSK